MIEDPVARGRALAAFHRSVAGRLWEDVLESGLLPDADESEQARRRGEWQAFSLYACVRGLVAAGGFNRETATAIDALHEAALEDMLVEGGSLVAFADARARIAERYAEYGRIGQEGPPGESSDALALRLGQAAAGHLVAGPAGELAGFVGALHETLAEGATQAVRAMTEQTANGHG
jgi:hypothetical protein